MSLGGSQKQTSTTKVNLPSWIQGPLQDIVARTSGLLNKPYEAYDGQRVADFTQDENNAFAMIRQLMGQTDPQLQQAQGISQEVANRGLNGFSQATLDQYMNPYATNVLDVAKQRSLDQFDLAKRGLSDQQAAIGSFGGSRSGLAEQSLYGNFARDLADRETLGLAANYDQAMNRAFQGTQLAGQAAMDYANLANSRLNTGLTEANALGQAGSQQRMLEQAGLDVNYQDFLAEQAYPYEQIQFASGIYNPIADLTRGSTTTQKTSSGGSGLSTALGIASMAMGIPGVGAAMGAGMGSMGLGSLASSIGGSVWSGAQNQIGNSLFNTLQSRGLFAEGGLVPEAKNRSYVPTAQQMGQIRQLVEQGQLDIPADTSGEDLKALLDLINKAEDPAIQEQIYNEETSPGGPTRGELLKMWEAEGTDSPVSPEVPTKGLGTVPVKGHTYEKELKDAASKFGVPVDLLARMMHTESAGKPGAISNKGASGLMQLMPETAKGLGVTDIFDPVQNINGGAKYIKQMLDRYDGDQRLALAAYNAGPGNVDKYGGIPPFQETQNYVKKIAGYAKGGVVNKDEEVNIYKNADGEYVFLPIDSDASKNLNKYQDRRSKEKDRELSLKYKDSVWENALQMFSGQHPAYIELENDVPPMFGPGYAEGGLVDKLGLRDLAYLFETLSPEERKMNDSDRQASVKASRDVFLAEQLARSNAAKQEQVNAVKNQLSSLGGGLENAVNYMENAPFTQAEPGDSRLERLAKGFGNIVPAAMRGLVAPVSAGKYLAGGDYIKDIMAPVYSDVEAMTQGVEQFADTPEKRQALREVQNRMISNALANQPAPKSMPVGAKQGLTAMDQPSKELYNLKNRIGFPEAEVPQEKEREVDDALFNFGAAMLGSKGNFFEALGEGAKAFTTTRKEEKMLEAAKQKAVFDQQMQMLRAQLYGKQVEAQTEKLNSPYAKQKQALDLQILQQKADGGNLQKRIDTFTQALLKNGVEPEEAMKQARQMAMTSAVASNLENPTAADDATSWSDEQLMNYLNQ